MHTHTKLDLGVKTENATHIHQEGVKRFVTRIVRLPRESRIVPKLV